jgi:hypothetical protein
MAYLYGFINMKDLYARRVTEVGVDEVNVAIERSVAEHNRQMDALMGLFVRRTTEFKTRFRTPVAARLQPLDNNGRALPIKPAGQYDVSFPLQQAGTAWGTNSVTGAYMTVEEAAEATAAMMDADFRWMRDHLLNAFFVDGSYTFTDELHGALTVYGLASGDATTYNIQSGSDTEATDDHVQGTASLANATFTGLYTELLEHPENSGEVVALVSSADRAAIEALSLFYPIANRNLRPGNSATVLDANLSVSLPGDVFGMVDRVWVAEWRSMPSNYLVAFTTGGEQPVAMREDPIAELRGFNRVADRTDYPWFERQYRRRAGFGAWNRVGAVILRTNNATYAAPTGYGALMP